MMTIMMMKFIVPLLLVQVSFAINTRVNTTDGPIQGFLSNNNSIYQFLGIPFAQPPVDDLRFRPPIPPKPWTTTLKTVERRSQCLQMGNLKGEVEGSEDCLYLNIVGPTNANKTSVMVWIHGGGWEFGNAYEKGDYRLGALGLFASKLLYEESNTTGNYALLDQQMVLRYVHENIERFGGDPNRVTIFSESAGAFSTYWHLVNTQSQEYFHRAILESGTGESKAFFQETDVSYSFSDAFATSVGCNSSDLSSNEWLQCIRKINAKQWFKSIADWFNPQWPFELDYNGGDFILTPFAPVVPWGATIDNSVLLDRPINLMKEGKISNNIPLIIGTNNNEGDIFLVALPLVGRNGSFLPSDFRSTKVILQHFFNDSTVDNIFNVYQLSSYKTYDTMLSRIVRDFFFICPTRRVALVYQEYNIPTYMYHFNYTGDWFLSPVLGDFHGSELPFVWSGSVKHNFTQRDEQMAQTFGQYWTNFAKFGTPNHAANILKWPIFTNETHLNIVLDVPTSLQSNYGDVAHCELWDTIDGIKPMTKINQKFL